MADLDDSFRHLMQTIMEGLTDENVKMIRYLCKDFIPHGRDLKTALDFLRYFEDKALITSVDMSFLAEVLYRINRHDLLKKLPEVKNRRDFEDNFLVHRPLENFTAFRIACLQLLDDITEQEFQTLKNLSKDSLSKGNLNRSKDVLTLLVCLEEEDLMCDGDLEFILNILKRLDNQVPYNTFFRLRNGDTTYVLPKRHQSSPNLPQTSSRSKMFHTSHSLPYMEKGYNPQWQGQRFVMHGPSAQLPVPQPSLTHLQGRTFGEIPDSGLEKPSASSSFQPHDFQVRSGFETEMKLPANSPMSASLRTASIFSEPTSAVQATQSTCAPSQDQETEKLLVEEQSPSVGNEGGCYNEPERNTGLSKNDGRVNENDVYPMKKNPCGMCLIINNEVFDNQVNQEELQRRLQLRSQDYQVPNTGFKNREGSKSDLEGLRILFTSFGFSVMCYENLGHREMKKALLECSKSDHSVYDCFVCVIMSHGLEGSVYGVDGMPVSLVQIKNAFKPDSCPGLTNKPKMFFFQACQGDRSMVGHSASQPIADVETDAPTPPRELLENVPTEADFLISHSTVPGYLSYRNKQTGSWFISALVENLEKFHSTEDVLSILTKVNSSLSNMPFKQMPMPIYTLRKKVFFTKRQDAAEMKIGHPVQSQDASM